MRRVRVRLSARSKICPKTASIERFPNRARTSRGLTIPTGLFAVLVVAILALLGMSARYYAHGDLNTIYCLLSLFFSTNLLICYWEVCLFLRPDHIEIRAGYWREKCSMTGRTPTREFLLTRVPLTRILSPTLWASMLVKVRFGPLPDYSGLGSRSRHPALLDERGDTCPPRFSGGGVGRPWGLQAPGSGGGSDRLGLGSRNRK